MVNLFVEDRTRVLAKGLKRDIGTTCVEFSATLASPGSLLTVKIVIDYEYGYAVITLATPSGDVSEQVGLESPAGKRLLELYQPDPESGNPSDEEFLAHIEKNTPVRASKSQ